MIGHKPSPPAKPQRKYHIGQNLRTIADVTGTVVATSFECGVWWYQFNQHTQWVAEHNILGEVKGTDPETVLADMPLEERLGDCLSIDYDKQVVVFRSRESAVVFKRFNPEWAVQFERIMEAAAVYPVRKPTPRRRPGSGTYPSTGAFR